METGVMGIRIATRGVRSWTALCFSAALTCTAPLTAAGTGQRAQTAPPPAGQGVQTTAPPAGQALTTPQVPVAAQGGPVLQLTMEQAVAMAVEANLGLKYQRLFVDIAAEGVAGAEAAFKPTLGAFAQTSSSTRLPSSFTDLTSGSIASSSQNGGANVSQFLPWLGGNYNVQWSTGRSTTNQQLAVFNPALNSQVQFNFTQPLLRNFLIDANRAGLENSQTTRQVADLDLQLQTITLQNAVRVAYLGLKAANAQLDVAKQNFDTAQKQFDDNKKRVAVGVAANSDIIQAEVQVEQNQEFVIQSQGGVASAEDNLRSLILDPSRPDYWTVRLEATDPIVVQPREIDLDAAVKTALANRLDVQEAHRNLEITRRTTRLDENLTKTQVNAVAQYSATSSGGTQFTYDLTGAVANTAVKGVGSVLSETFSGAYPSWVVGVNVGYPIGRSAAEASLAQQQLVQRQAELNLHILELNVAAAVRQAARDVQTNYQVVQASHAALTAAEKQLDDERRMLEVGLSSTFELLSKTQILTQARTSDIQAQIFYNMALLAFDRQLRVK
jgi:outer membrane protein